MKKFCFVNMLLLLVIIFSFDVRTTFGSDLQDRTDEINEYIEILTSGTLNKKIEAAKIIERSGYSDTRLFDVIEKELLAEYLVAEHSVQIDYIAWLCKALASSGMERYKPTLVKVMDSSNNKKIKRYAEQSLDRFDEYAQRRKIISDNKYAMEGRDPEVARLMNMLASNVMNVKRDAAKLITRNDFSDPELYKLVNNELLDGYNRYDDDVSIDTMAWLCMALANSGDANYKITLQKVADTTKHQKLAKYAKKALATLN